jgi:hypothetical protein
MENLIPPGGPNLLEVILVHPEKSLNEAVELLASLSEMRSELI